MAQPTTSPKIEELRFRLKTDPKSRLFYPLAEELRKIGQFDEAEKVLRTGLESHPSYLSAWVSFGRVLRDQKKDGEASEALTRALQIDPGNVVAARLLADAYLALGEKVEAIKKYKLVHALLPTDQDVAAIITKLDHEINPPEAVTAAEPASAAVELASEEESAAPEATPFEMSAAADGGAAENASPFASATEEESPFGGDESEPAQAQLTSPVFGSHSQPDSPFASPRVAADETNPWTRGGNALSAAFAVQQEEQRVEEATGDAEPMSAAHDESPFETAASDAGYTAAAFQIEQPSGVHLSRAPLAAELPSETAPADDLPLPDAAVVAPEPLVAELSNDETSDLFGYESPAEPFPADAQPVAAPDSEDFTNTLTMADLYARQGLTADARHIYENILARDPGHATVRAKLDALLAPPPAPAAASPEPVSQAALATASASDLDAAPVMMSMASSNAAKVARLNAWLARVGRREVSGV